MSKHEGMSNDKMTERILTSLRRFGLRASFVIRHSDFVIKVEHSQPAADFPRTVQRFTLVAMLST
jgi:hypothetical protein